MIPFILQIVLAAVLGFSMLVTSASQAEESVSPNPTKWSNELNTNIHKKKKSKKKKHSKKHQGKQKKSDASTQLEPEASEPLTIKTNHAVAANIGFFIIGTGVGAEYWNQYSKNLQLGLQILSIKGEVDAKSQSDSNQNFLFYEYISINDLMIKFKSRYFFSETFYVSGG